MLTITTKRLKNGGFESDITTNNTSVHEILAAFDTLIDALEQHDVSTLAIVDYVINRENYIDRKEDK